MAFGQPVGEASSLLGAPTQITDLLNGQVLTYNAATNTWQNTTPAGTGVASLNGLTGALSIGAGNGINVSAAGSTVTVSVKLNGATLSLSSSGLSLNLANPNSWTGAQTFGSGDLILAGSTSGTTTLNAAAAAGTTTATLPANTGTIAELNYAQTWSALQTFSAGDLAWGGYGADSITTPAKGDLWYYNGTNVVNLPIGTSTYVLTVISGVPVWAAAAAAGVSSLNTLTGALTLTTPNSTLSIGTSGSDVTLDINLGNANTWTAAQTFNAKTTLGSTLASSAAQTWTLQSNTAASLKITDGTNAYYTVNTQTATSAVAGHTFGVTAPTIASAAGVTYSTVNITPPTLTLTGTTTVTSVAGLGLYIAAPTITDTSTITVTNASTVYIANAPVPAGNVTITNRYALYLASGTGGNLGMTGTLLYYNALATLLGGLPAIYAGTVSLGAVSAVTIGTSSTSITTYAPSASGNLFLVVICVSCKTSVTLSSLTVTYTDDYTAATITQTLASSVSLTSNKAYTYVALCYPTSAASIAVAGTASSSNDCAATAVIMGLGPST